MFKSMSRRSFLERSSVGLAASSWLAQVARAAENGEKKPAKSVVLLWLNGGPATIDLWDLKPGHANGGPLKPIETDVAGIHISPNLPKLSKWMSHMALVRSLTSKEGDHARAARFVRTGYVPQASIDFPDLGALVAHAIGSREAHLPNFVSILPPARDVFTTSGFLGPYFGPLMIGSQATIADELNVPNLLPAAGIASAAVRRRQELLRDVDGTFQKGRADSLVENYATATQRAVEIMRPEVTAAFDLAAEPESTREAYGPGLFNQGCLLARRLVERGVSFVEVTLNGWDTHQQNFERVKALSQQLDQSMAALLTDLKSRGLLESTLVIAIGEFGRTPKINDTAGRDHWPKSWAAALAGAIPGGQVIGKTSDDGTQVSERPVTVPDLIATVCKSLGIDPRQQNVSNVARPIRIADPAAKPIEELL